MRFKLDGDMIVEEQVVNLKAELCWKRSEEEMFYGSYCLQTVEELMGLCRRSLPNLSHALKTQKKVGSVTRGGVLNIDVILVLFTRLINSVVVQ
jgi:hypothetical protein